MSNSAVTRSTRSDARPLSLWLATALVIGNMVGSGVFLLPASLAPYRGWAIVAWVFTAAGSFLLAYVLSQMAHRNPEVGGPYAYSRRSFGDFVGFQTAWGYWLAAWMGNVAIATAFVAYLGHFVDPLAGSSAGDHVLQAGTALGAIWFLTAVNLFGVRSSGLVQGATTILKTLPLAAIAFVGIFWASGSSISLHPDGGSNYSAFNSAALLTLWAFIGFESATIPAQHVRDPKRNVRRATLIGTAVTAVIYVLGAVAVMGVLPADTLSASSAPFADAATQMWGGWAGDAVAIGAIVSAFGCLNGWILLQGQMPYAAATDRLFPRAFGRLNRHGVPAVGIVVSSVLMTAFVIPSYNSSTVDRFTDFVLLATTTTLIAYLYGVAARLVQLIGEVGALSTRAFRREAALATLAVAYSLWLVYGAGYRYATWAFLLVAAGIPLYAWLKYEARGESPQAVPTPPEVIELVDYRTPMTTSRS
jgi:APA family basic amino acid/polyamine antiporter